MSETKAETTSQPVKQLSASEFYAVRDGFDVNVRASVTAWQKTVDEAQACGLSVNCKGGNVAGALLFKGEQMIPPPNAIKADAKPADKAKSAKE